MKFVPKFLITQIGHKIDLLQILHVNSILFAWALNAAFLSFQQEVGCGGVLRGRKICSEKMQNCNNFANFSQHLKFDARPNTMIG